MSLEIQRAKRLMRMKLVAQPNVITHIEKVTEKALELGRKLKEKRVDVDLELLETAGYLHDIGRSVTHGVDHGIEGTKILKKYGFSEPVIKIVERHIGAGITLEEASNLGLPKRDFIPQTLEEKILAYADKFLESEFVFKTVEGEQIIERKDVLYDTIEPTLNKFKNKFGSESPVVFRLKNLRDEMEHLLK